ncbi:PH-like domain-containing protein [Subtercola frigoramans]|uniref:PH domain-containing protein n=1 Tax=Subtercola frigoramans TaxID=120298 RepID=A0ABS2L583_9MICO|nr:hypothetical protein [Subtercola frigoramans]MBM7472174.1 hypothetical protein [Subtercola frigoramans]
MDRIGPALIVLAILIVIYAAMALGWRARKRRQAAFTAQSETPKDAGNLLLEVPMLYVATTPANKPLERLTIKGLAFRGRGTFIVWQHGVTLSVNGEPDVFVPVADIRSIGTSTYTIDRVVESGGLVRLDWTSALDGDDEARLNAATAGANRAERNAAIARAISTAHDTAEAAAAVAAATEEFDHAHPRPRAGDRGAAQTGHRSSTATIVAHSTADVESYVRILDQADSTRVLEAVDGIVAAFTRTTQPNTPPPATPTQEGTLA